MKTISITYTLKYRLKSNPEYCWTKDGKCFNVKTGRRIKQVYNNGCIGYSIKGKFHSAKKLRGELEKIPNEYCPF